MNSSVAVPLARRHLWLTVLVVTLAMQLTAAVVGIIGGAHQWRPAIRTTLWLPLSFFPHLLALVALHRLRLSRRVAIVVVMSVTLVLQVIAVLAPPQTSSDVLRYVWDAKVQLAGISPYRYVPNAPELAALHEPSLFYTQGCDLPTGCARLNRPNVPTIYPPVAQLAFVLIRLAGLNGGVFAFQLAGAIAAVVTTALLLRRAKSTATPIWPAAVWGWSPIVLSEFTNNAHIDWVAISLTVAALALFARSRPGWAGVLIGAAIATKFYPALIGVTLLKRRPLLVIGAAAAVVIGGYIPHLLAVGTAVAGYLPGYLNEEGYESGNRLQLLVWLPTPLSWLVAAAILATVAWVARRRTDPDRPELTAVWVMGTALLVVTPNYSWYTGLLLILIALTRRWQWLLLTIVPAFTYLAGRAGVNHALYGATAAITLGCLYFTRTKPSTAAAVPSGSHRPHWVS